MMFSTLWHVHAFPPDGQSSPLGADDLVDDRIGRFDAIETEERVIFVWDAENRKITRFCETREEAESLAKESARQYGQMYGVRHS